MCIYIYIYICIYICIYIYHIYYIKFRFCKTLTVVNSVTRILLIETLYKFRNITR